MQTSPVDLAAVREQEDEVLDSYGWVDKGAGVVRIPIERALELVAKRGPAEPPAAGRASRHEALVPSRDLGVATGVRGLRRRANGGRAAARRSRDVGIEQRLDQAVPLDLAFRDESGTRRAARRLTSAASR